jgi:hypothetical protein
MSAWSVIDLDFMVPPVGYPQVKYGNIFPVVKELFSSKIETPGFSGPGARFTSPRRNQKTHYGSFSVI